MADADVNAKVEDTKKDYVEDGKNKLNVKCKFCNSKILDKQSANYITQEVIILIFRVFIKRAL